MQELQYTSFLYYFIELALVNELVGTTVKITPRSDQVHRVPRLAVRTAPLTALLTASLLSLTPR